MSNAVIVEQIGSSRVIRFNRPEIRNPLSIDVLCELSSIVAAVQNQSAVSRLIFTGTGNVFASGADLREMAQVEGHAAAGFAVRGQTLMRQIEELPVPTVAAINGLCFGGALDLALACGRRIASPDAVFSHPGAGLGIITGWGGTQRLPRLIGEAAALEMFFTTNRVSSSEALRLGLVHEIALEPLARALANLI